MISKGTILLCLVICFLITGCGGGDRVENPPPFQSDYAEDWEGTWVIPELYQSGTISLTIAADGKISGTLNNETLMKTSSISGTSDNTNFAFSYQYDSTSGTVKGTFGLNENHHLIGNFNNTISGNTYEGSFDLTLKTYGLAGCVFTGDGTNHARNIKIQFSNGYGTVNSDYYEGWRKEGFRGSVTVIPYRYGYSFDVPSKTFSTDTSNINFYIAGFQDDFSNTGSGWMIGNSTIGNAKETSYLDYINNEYEMVINTKNQAGEVYFQQNAFALFPVNYGSHIYDAEVKAYPFTPTDTYCYGLSIWSVTKKYAFFVRASDQSYAIYQITTASSFDLRWGWTPIKDWTSDSHINQSTPNIIKISQNDSQVSFIVNGYTLDSRVFDLFSSSKEMMIMLVAANLSTSQFPLKIRFDDFTFTNQVIYP